MLHHKTPARLENPGTKSDHFHPTQRWEPQDHTSGSPPTTRWAGYPDLFQCSIRKVVVVPMITTLTSVFVKRAKVQETVGPSQAL